VTVREISIATGFSFGAVYRHFGINGGLISKGVLMCRFDVHSGIASLHATDGRTTYPCRVMVQPLDQRFCEMQIFNPTIVRKCGRSL
jgi:hypothetical protein